MGAKPRLSEDWLAVYTGLFIFILSLATFFGADVLGWVVTTSVWMDVGKALAPASKAYAGLHPLVSLGLRGVSAGGAGVGARTLGAT